MARPALVTCLAKLAAASPLPSSTVAAASISAMKFNALGSMVMQRSRPQEVQFGQRAQHQQRFGFAAMPQPESGSEDDLQAADFSKGEIAPHRSMKSAPRYWVGTVPADVGYVMHNPVYSKEYMEAVQPKHVPPETISEKLAYRGIQLVRTLFDKVTGYEEGKMTEAKWLQRVLFLETIAGCPGMVAGMLRHLRSLRTMRPDHGWINTLLDEAENERMHLLTFLQLREPGLIFRTMVILAQGVYFNAYFLLYLVSPRTCHAAVGYLEEEAVKTYTHVLKEIDAGRLWKDRPAPAMAMKYWQLPEGATMRDLVLAIRADEACHSHVNHTFSRISQDSPNPFGVGASQIL